MAPMFQMKVKYFEGDRAVFAQRIRLTGGAYEVTGYLQYGACNDENCLPPTNVEFSLDTYQLLSIQSLQLIAFVSFQLTTVLSRHYFILYDNFDFFVYNKPYINIIHLLTNPNIFNRFIIRNSLVNQQFYKSTCCCM